jgi:4-amino-4-deoxy-L-arabinose transferase-like glycosyltransferase
MQRVRLLSLAFGLATVLGCWALARQLWPENWCWQVTAVALIVFNPTFLYISNGVTNDSLLIALCTWGFVLMGCLLCNDNPQISWREWTLALLLGAAILTKQTGFILLPPALLTLLIRARQVQWSRRWLWLVLAGGVVMMTAVGGWWYLFNGIVYGDPLALESHNALPPVESIVERLQFLLAQSWGAFKSYWAAFGWATIFVTPIWYVWFVALTVLGFTGWFGQKRFALSLPKRPSYSYVSSNKLTQILWLAVLLNGALMLVWLWRTAAPYGRLFFPVIAPLSCQLVLGWQRWEVRLRWPEAQGPFAVVLPLAKHALVVPVR